MILGMKINLRRVGKKTSLIWEKVILIFFHFLEKFGHFRMDIEEKGLIFWCFFFFGGLLFFGLAA